MDIEQVEKTVKNDLEEAAKKRIEAYKNAFEKADKEIEEKE